MEISAYINVSLTAFFHYNFLAKMERYGRQPTRKQCQIHWLDSGGTEFNFSVIFFFMISMFNTKMF